MKSTESSVMLAFRVIVMLSCIVLVPLAAVLGSAFPDVVKSLLVDRVVQALGMNEGDASAAPAPLPFNAGEWRVSAPTPANELTDAPSWPSQPQDSTPDTVPSRSLVEKFRDDSPFDRPAVAADGPLAPIRPAGPGKEPPAGGVIQAGAFIAANPRESTSPSRQSPGDGSNPPAPAGTSGSPGNVGAGREYRHDRSSERFPTLQGQFTAIEQRLRQHGATYYLLETWGAAGDSYRFYCKMQVAGNPSHVRQFEAVGRDPLEAMQRVLADVEQWRGGRGSEVRRRKL